MGRSEKADRQLLNVEGLQGGYGRLTVFRDVELRLIGQQAIGITGVNGAGKTTLAHTLAGLLPEQAGRTYLEGSDITGEPAHRRVAGGLVLVPEGRQIIGSLSVYENLRLASESARHDPTGMCLEDVHELFPRLRDRANQRGGSLSGGEQQMLAIGRAMLSHPRVLMLDEPTQGLAPVVIQDVVRALEHLRESVPMLIIEQNRSVLEQLVDHIGIMRNGALTFDS